MTADEAKAFGIVDDILLKQPVRRRRRVNAIDADSIRNRICVSN